MNRKGILALAISLLFCFFCFSCFNRENQSTPRRVNLYVWSVYLPDQILKQFEQETGVQVVYDTFESNEALLEKIQSGVTDYDVIVPSDFMVTILRRENLLEKLDRAKIPNLKNISPRFLGLSYDPGNEYSVPLMWSTTGIGYNKSKVTDPVNTWGILWNPKYSNRILMLDDMRECFSAALKWKGYSANTTDPARLKEARDLLAAQKPLLKTYNSSNFDEILMSGDVWLALAWNGYMVRAKEENPDLEYVIPDEGSAYAVENFCIPRGAPHIDDAHLFINYCLDAKVGAEITNLAHHPNANEAAKAYIKPELLNNPIVYPDESVLNRCELFTDLGPTYQVLDRYWTEIKSN